MGVDAALACDVSHKYEPIIPIIDTIIIINNPIINLMFIHGESHLLNLEKFIISSCL